MNRFCLLEEGPYQLCIPQSFGFIPCPNFVIIVQNTRWLRLEILCTQFHSLSIQPSGKLECSQAWTER